MKWLIVLLAVTGTFAVKDAMIESNRVPSETDAVASFGSTCDQCQSLVKRFVLASKDPAKMRELKLLLNVLCHETSYVDECRIFVDNLDNLIKKLEPYLEDTHAVCKSIHMCSNNRLDAFRRIALLYVRRVADKADAVKDMICDECQFAAAEVRKLVEDKEKQKEIREFFANRVCIHAGSYRGMCDMLVEQFLPEFFEELEVILKDTKKACADLGFCAAPRRSKLVASPSASLAKFCSGAKNIELPTGQVLAMSCLECKLTMETVLLELEDQRNLLAKDLQNFACLDLLPKNFTPSCEDFLSMYAPTVIYMTIQQFSPEGICTSMHTCTSSSLSVLSDMPKPRQNELRCHACAGIQEYLKSSLVNDFQQHDAVALAQDHFCTGMISSFNGMCESVVARVVPAFMNKAAKLAASGQLCQAC